MSVCHFLVRLFSGATPPIHRRSDARMGDAQREETCETSSSDETRHSDQTGPCQIRVHRMHTWRADGSVKTAPGRRASCRWRLHFLRPPERSLQFQQTAREAEVFLQSGDRWKPRMHIWRCISETQWAHFRETTEINTCLQTKTRSPKRWRWNRPCYQQFTPTRREEFQRKWVCVCDCLLCLRVHFCRTFSQMPSIWKMRLSNCSGSLSTGPLGIFVLVLKSLIFQTFEGNPE